MLVHSKIYQTVLDHCGAYRTMGEWSGFCADVDCKVTTDCSSALLSDLIEHFAVSDLTESGVAEGLPDGLVLTPVLGNGARPIVALRESPTSTPYDLLTSDGLISKRGLPAIAILKDYRTRQLLKQNGRVFVA